MCMASSGLASDQWRDYGLSAWRKRVPLVGETWYERGHIVYVACVTNCAEDSPTLKIEEGTGERKTAQFSHVMPSRPSYPFGAYKTIFTLL